jgi:hypothetical protein
MSMTKYAHTRTIDYSLSSRAVKSVTPTISFWRLLPTVEALCLIVFKVSGIAHVIHFILLKINQEKSSHETFSTTQAVCPRVTTNDVQLPVRTNVKYLRLHLDQRLTWSAHIKSKRFHLDLKLRSMCWLLGRKSQLSLANKLFLCKCVLKPVWRSTLGLR